MSKRPRDEDEADLNAEEDEDNHIALPVSTSRAAQKQGKDCPYLDAISRQVSSV